MQCLELRVVKGLYAAALGIEILCIGAAELGENTGLYMFDFIGYLTFLLVVTASLTALLQFNIE